MKRFRFSSEIRQAFCLHYYLPQCPERNAFFLFCFEIQKTLFSQVVDYQQNPKKKFTYTKQIGGRAMSIKGNKSRYIVLGSLITNLYLFLGHHHYYSDLFDQGGRMEFEGRFFIAHLQIERKNGLHTQITLVGVSLLNALVWMT